MRAKFEDKIVLVITSMIDWLVLCKSYVVKVGMVGDSQIGKTSLMVKYVEGHFDEDYIQTLGKYIRQTSID